MKNTLLSFSLLIVLFSFGFSNLSYGQGVSTAGGVDVDGSWYLGEGLQAGDYFEYSLCELDLNDCAPIKLQMWINGEIPYESETLWDAKVVIYDGDKIIKGSWWADGSIDDDSFVQGIQFLIKEGIIQIS